MASDRALIGLCVEIPDRFAADALARLGDAGLIDDRRRPVSEGGRVRIPVVAAPGPEAAGGIPLSLVEAALPRNPRLAPSRVVRHRLTGTLPAHLLDALPQGWQVLGDVAVVKLADELRAHGALVGEALGETLGVRAVLASDGSHGELREPNAQLLWGEPVTETVHREHGIVYHLDPARVMFSAGNHHERHRLVDAVDQGECVVDLFAGVGYFALPLARAGARVTACEKNPVSAGYLRRNVVANGLTCGIEVREGDARDVAPEGVADRVLMGYFPGTEAFVATALAALRAAGGLVHYHTTAWVPDAVDTAWRELAGHPALRARDVDLVDGHVVKSYAPNVAHVVLDLEVGPG